ncbi:MAG TPA: GNAT family N-acetyltransferase [Thermoanaerobaculia bacterium]|jgi:hypothetical protein
MTIDLLSQRPGDVTLPDGASSRMPQSDPSWIAALREVGEEADALVARDGERVTGWLPFTIRRSEAGTVLSSQPYLAYGGPVVRDDDPELTRALLEAYVDLAKREGAVAVTLGTPPFLAQETERVWRDCFAPDYVHENFVQVSAPDALPHAEHRRQARRAAAAGFTVARNDADLTAWREIYLRRYVELGAVPYPEALQRGGELWTARLGGTLAGGTLFLVDGTTADYYAAAYERGEYAPQNLVLETALRDFARRGIRRVNWESSPGRGGVYDYKRRWGAGESRHYYYSRVLDRSLLRRSPDEIRRAFPLRFVVPFSALEPA